MSTLPCVIRYTRNELVEVVYIETEEVLKEVMDSINSPTSGTTEYQAFTLAIHRQRIQKWEDII